MTCVNTLTAAERHDCPTGDGRTPAKGLAIHPPQPAPCTTVRRQAVFDGAAKSQLTGSPARPPLFGSRRSKIPLQTFLTAEDVIDIVHRYQVGETTQGIGDRYGISKTRVADVLSANNVSLSAVKV